ncbi:acetyl-CoA carboxylase biotin carboxylase subunit [Shouchella shacheensis]|uniref:acetyl-CoA carboxylase biotin carboxylase subunit n=1 Tax=Shouchella shacheensis TaxID=1649580 RepID=UPI00073FDF7A|nr:acetyl-CoA carboxylase biotin carboxylase subunit [Shouchella shacheensis]
MIKKLLIANRGEIACRIIRTCRRMGIQTIAVYSEADERARHVQDADEAYLLGGARVNESYLNVDKLLEIAKNAGADAVHPGYGLLSENAVFAKRCEDEGLPFVGPDARAIQAMGDKVKARATMERAGVPVIPGSSGCANEEEAVQEASRIGYPVMLKAAAGGGGIGIDVVRNEEECRKAFVSNAKKANMFFGDSEIFVEKYLENPRHIEIQVLADGERTLAFGERDCSVQRRHQKVIEEAPSPYLTETRREEMCQMAIQAAEAISYVNAGTVECLVDEDGSFYFLEMNTRLQVEHPVTEEIFGIDLVEWQLRITSGEKLAMKQEDLSFSGHAIEARLYAEDPVRFFPSPGTITAFEKPEADYIRHECPLEVGTVITPFYDPMIAKIIVSGKSRQQAVERMQKALASYRVEGIKTNLPLLLAVCKHKAFLEGEATTRFIETYKNELITGEKIK